MAKVASKQNGFFALRSMVLQKSKRQLEMPLTQESRIIATTEAVEARFDGFQTQLPSSRSQSKCVRGKHGGQQSDRAGYAPVLARPKIVIHLRLIQDGQLPRGLFHDFGPWFVRHTLVLGLCLPERLYSMLRVVL